MPKMYYFISQVTKVPPADLKDLVPNYPMGIPFPDSGRDAHARSLITIGEKDGSPQVAVLTVGPWSDQEIGIGGTYWRWRVNYDPWLDPYLWPNGSKVLRQFGHEVAFSKPDDWIVAHPEEALREVLEAAQKLNPQHVGPPYAIVHFLLDKSGPRGASIPHRIVWIASGSCPSWDTSVVPDP